MHLTKRILPFIVTQALKGNTWANDAVFDSPGDLGKIAAEGGGQGIFIAVYCDEWDQREELEPNIGPAEGPGTFKIVIEVGVSEPVVAETDADSGAQTKIAATDPGLEWSIAFISEQAIARLKSRGIAWPWSSLFNRFIAGGLEDAKIRRGGPPNDGRTPAPRYASCVTILKVRPSCMQPQRGQIVSAEQFAVWHDLLAMMGQYPDYVKLAGLIRAHFEPVDGVQLPEDAIDGGRMWLPEETMAALGLAIESDMRFVKEPARRPGPEAARGDVPIDAADMRRWLAEQGPDPSQGPIPKGPPVDAG